MLKSVFTLKRVLLAALLLVLALPTVVLFYLLYSEQGLKLLVSQLDRLQGLSIKIDDAQGRLAGPLDIGRFELTHPRVHIVVTHLHADLRPTSLFAGVIEATELAADSVVVRVIPGGEKSDTPPRFVPGRMRVQVGRADIRGVSFAYAQGAPITADRLAGRVALSAQNLRVTGLEAVTPVYELKGALELIARRELNMNIAVDGSYKLPADVTLVGHAEVSGTPQALDMRARLNAPATLEAAAKLTFQDQTWRIAGSARSPSFPLMPWLKTTPFTLENVALQFTADARVLSVSGDLSSPQLGNLPLHLVGEGSYRDRVLRIARADIVQKNGDGAIHAAGEVRLGEDAPVIDAAAQWRNLTWPLGRGDAALIASRSGELTLSGQLPYAFTLNGDVALPRAPALQPATSLTARVNADGSLSKEALSFDYRIENLCKNTVAAPAPRKPSNPPEPVVAETKTDASTVCPASMQSLAARAAGDARLAFGTPQTWQLRLNVSDFDPGALRPEFPGRIALQAAASGSGFDARGNYALNLTDLHGVLRKQPLSARGQLRYSAQTWQGQDIQVSYGATQLRANGEFGKQMNFTATLHSKDLQQLGIGLAGAVDAELRASGPRTAPHGVATVASAELGYGEWQLNQLKLTADVDAANKLPSNLALNIGRLSQGRYAADDVHLVGAGTVAEHRLEFSAGLGAAGEKLATLGLQLNGRYTNKSWEVALEGARVADADAKERARLSKPANLSLSRDRLDIQELCYTFDDSHGCVQGQWNPTGEWRARASIDDLPLSLFNSGQPEALRYSGHAQAKIDMHGTADAPFQGSASAQLIDGAIAYSSIDARYETVPIDTARLDVTGDGQALSATLHVAAGTDTRLEANARITRDGRSAILQWPLTGALRAHTSEAKILPLLFASVDRASGVFDTNLQVSGTLALPRLRGELQLQQGELALYQLNLALRELNVLARIDDNRLDLEGKGRAGDGTLDLGGNLSWRNSQLFGNLRLKGQNLLVADLPDYRVVASPDLDFMFEARDINIVGEILIPSARLQPEDVSGAVQLSTDARMIDDKNLGAGPGFKVISEVRIRLGDDVQVDALGLQGRLGGYVGATLRSGEPAIGRGELNVVDGRYEAYGQKLEIKRGRLIFDVSPLDDPGLDIQAERKVNDIVVGVNVRGVLRAPRLQFYSTPSMSQTQIVSYLIVGKPFDQLQGSDASTVRSASNTLAMQGGGYLAAQLGRRIGLEEVGVETDANNQSALVLGKFLSPRLFVSYGISLTEAINTLKLRYTISDKWVLKTEAGAAQSADVEFTIER